jgi:hypothetical protein
MRKFILLATAVLFTAGIGLSAAVAAESPKEALKIEVEGHKKPGVTFDHQAHLKANEGLKCETCHHKIDGKEKEEKCTNCHGEKAEGKTPSIKDAMHAKDKGACYGCHFGSDAKKKLKCSDCHKD